jgi:hypothetical protein
VGIVMEKLKNKKILLICMELSSYPMYFLGKKLEEEGNDVAYFFTHFSEVVLNKNMVNKSTYYYFKDNIDNAKIFDVKDINLEFNENYKTAKPDMKYLAEMEKKYGKNKNLNQQIISSQTTSTPYHDRWFYNSLTYEQTLYWMELNYKKSEEVLDFYKPDVLLDLDTAEIQRTILNEVCSVKKVPYITIEYPRYESWITPTFNLGLGQELFFREQYKVNLKKNLSIEIQDILNFRNQDKIMAKRFMNDSTSSYCYSIKDEMKRLLLIFYTEFQVQILSKNIKSQLKFSLPLYSHSFRTLYWHFLISVKRAFLFSRFNKLFCNPKDEDYVYMPLHLIPESTTFVKSPMYIDELSIIHAASKSLPIGWKLYVKEHQSMIGERPISFYKSIGKLYNVKLVKINYYNDPKPWILKSKGVITISGSSAFEARMLSKPATVFGHVCFNIIDGIEVVNSISDLKKIFTDFSYYEHKDSDILSCASYLKTIKDVGVNLDIKKMVALSARVIIKDDFNNTELPKLINKLFDFYNKSYEIFIKEQKL